MDTSKEYREVTTSLPSKRLVAADNPLFKMADAVADKRLELDAIKEAEKEAQAAYDEVEAALFDAMEKQGLTAIRTPRGLFRLNDLAWASVQDPDLARNWAEANLPEAIRLDSQRLSVIVRQALKAGEPLPPGVSFRATRKITWRRE